MNLQAGLPLDSNHPRIKPLRASFSPDDHAWFNEYGLGSAGKTRRYQKSLLKCVYTQRIKRLVPGNRGLVANTDLAAALTHHHDYPMKAGQRTQRAWVVQAIKQLALLTDFVTVMPTYILLNYFHRDHGTDEQIDAHHQNAAKQHRRNQAAWAAKERAKGKVSESDYALNPTSQPVKHVVESELCFRLTPKPAHSYNASPPTLKRPEPKQASGFAAKRPKRAGAVSANRANKTQADICLTSIRLRSGKTLAQPSSIPAIPAYRQRSDFDPRANAKAKRVYAHGPLDAPFVSMMVKEHKQLAGLSYGALRRRGATNDTLYMACHLMTNSQHKVTKPVGWVMWMEKALRDGKGKYAG